MSGAPLALAVLALCGLAVVSGAVGVAASLLRLRVVRAIEWLVLSIAGMIAGALIGASVAMAAGGAPTALLS